MKKISTAAVKQANNFAEQKLTIGLDLGDRSSWYCLLDEVGEVLLEQKVSTTPKAMREVFGSMPRCRIALETGMHSPWVSRALSELGHEVIVAHARNVRLIGESRKKRGALSHVPGIAASGRQHHQPAACSRASPGSRSRRRWLAESRVCHAQ
jgi:transposase